MSWPKRIRDHGGLRSQFHHVIDIMPTILEAAGIRHPDVVNGTPQKPIEGSSMMYSFDNVNSPSPHKTQYFEILGNRAIYHEGWIASCYHGRVPWVRSQPMAFDGPNERWELYNIVEDFSQSEDLADKYPQKLKELRALFDKECRKYNVYPLDDNTTVRGLPGNRPSLLEGRTRFTYYRDNVRMPELAVVNMKNTSFDLTAELDIPRSGVEGVIICQGGNMAGWSLCVANSRPVYYYNWMGHEIYSIESAEPLPAGRVSVKLVFDYDGGGLGKGGAARLMVNERVVAEGRIEKTVPFLFSMSGETLDVGEDTGAPVGPYNPGFAFTGGIRKVEIEIRPALDTRSKQDATEGELVGALRAQ
jgi:arylsulfatase